VGVGRKRGGSAPPLSINVDSDLAKVDSELTNVDSELANVDSVLSNIDSELPTLTADWHGNLTCQLHNDFDCAITLAIFIFRQDFCYLAETT
jgi:hypothetical protein